MTPGCAAVVGTAATIPRGKAGSRCPQLGHTCRPTDHRELEPEQARWLLGGGCTCAWNACGWWCRRAAASWRRRGENTSSTHQPPRLPDCPTPRLKSARWVSGLGRNYCLGSGRQPTLMAQKSKSHTQRRRRMWPVRGFAHMCIVLAAARGMGRPGHAWGTGGIATQPARVRGFRKKPCWVESFFEF